MIVMGKILVMLPLVHPRGPRTEEKPTHPPGSVHNDRVGSKYLRNYGVYLLSVYFLPRCVMELFSPLSHVSRKVRNTLLEHTDHIMRAARGDGRAQLSTRL